MKKTPLVVVDMEMLVLTVVLFQVHRRHLTATAVVAESRSVSSHSGCKNAKPPVPGFMQASGNRNRHSDRFAVGS